MKAPVATCSGTGFRGREAISELLPLTPQLRKLILDRVPADVFRDAAGSEGMQSCANRPLPRQWQASLHSRRSIVSPSWIDRLRSLGGARKKVGLYIGRQSVALSESRSVGGQWRMSSHAEAALPLPLFVGAPSQEALAALVDALRPLAGAARHVCRCMSRSPIRRYASRSFAAGVAGRAGATAHLRAGAWRRTSGSLRQPATARFSARVRMAPAQCC